MAVVAMTGDAVRCFDCNSYNDSKCALEKPPQELIKNCSDRDTDKIKYTMCRKITQTIEFEVNGREFVLFEYLFTVGRCN